MNDPQTMNNAAMWAGLVGFFMPIAVSIVVQQRWTDAQKSAAAFCCCIVAAAGTAWFGGMFDAVDIARNFLIVFTLAVATYYGFWKPTGIAPRIESATSF